MLRSVLGVLATVFALCGYCQEQRAGTLWYSAGHVLLGVSEPGVGFSGSWQFDRADNGDIRIIKDEQRLGSAVKGTVMAICDDHALLMKDIKRPSGPATDELDGPIHFLQLMLRLLDRTLPKGPRSVIAESNVNARDDANPIRVKASNSSAEFLPPWQARGKVMPLGGEQIGFEVTFSYTTAAAKGRQLEMTLTGLWREASRVPVFDGEMPLADWDIYRVDQAVRMVSGVGVLERRAALQPIRAKTLGDLRAHIERGWQLDPRRRGQVDCKL